MDFALSFINLTLLMLHLTAPVWLVLILLVVVLGQVAGRIEN